MRISDSSLIAQMIQSTTKEGNQTSPTLKVGDILNAIVAEVLEGGLLLNLEGQLLRASVKTPQDFSLQEQVFLKVVKGDEQQIFVEKISSDEASMITQEKNGLTEALKALELPNTLKNQVTLEALNAFKNPLTLNHVKQLQVEAKSLETVLQKWSATLQIEGGNKALAQLPLKELAIALEKELSLQEKTIAVDRSANENTENSKALQVLSSGLKLTDKSDAGLTQKLDLLELVETPRTGEKLETNHQIKANEAGDQLSKGTKEAILMPEKAREELTTILQHLVGLKDPKEAQKALSFLMKMDIPASPQSLFAIDQIFNRTQLKSVFTEMMVSSEFKGSSEVEKALMDIKDLLSRFEPERFKSQEEVMQLSKKLLEAVKRLEASESKGILQNPDFSISNKAVTETLRSPQLPFVLSQFPLFLNNKIETMELYVEKRHKGKKIDPDDTRLYVSLSTEKMGQVGAMIEIYHRTITVTLDTTIEKVKIFLDAHLSEMKESLEVLGYGIRVQTELKDQKMRLQDLHQQFEPIQFTRFDKKV